MRGESAARPGKRPLRSLSAAEKMEAIQRVHDGGSKASVARDIGVPESTLRGWCKSEHKIRGMARNSCTPDSEAHSPASGSGKANNSSFAGTSEDEGCNGKRRKMDVDAAAPARDHLDPKLEAGQPNIDYAALMASVAGLRPENGGSLLLHQLGLLSSATNAIHNNLLQVPSTGMLGAQSNPVVGLVTNGLQYTRNMAIANRQQSNSAAASTSAAAPTQLDMAKKSGPRKSLPPAAEAPFVPAPSSPRKTENHHQYQGKTKASVSEGAAVTKTDDALWLWLTQQQQMLCQQSAMCNSSGNQEVVGGSWFWKWYKQFGFPPNMPTSANGRLSPANARAVLDQLLCNNNSTNHNENVRRMQQSAANAQLNMKEGIAHGEKFLEWLIDCSEPPVSCVQIMQISYLLENLKRYKKPCATSESSKK